MNILYQHKFDEQPLFFFWPFLLTLQTFVSYLEDEDEEEEEDVSIIKLIWYGNIAS